MALLYFYIMIMIFVIKIMEGQFIFTLIITARTPARMINACRTSVYTTAFIPPCKCRQYTLDSTG